MLIASPAKKPLQGQIQIPGDKSISHRALILGSLCQGRIEVENFLPSEDCLHSLQAMRQLGVNISHRDESLIIDGVGLHGLQSPSGPIDCGNSGTLMRLLCGLLAGQPFTSTLVGDASLSLRPMARVIEPLSQMGAQFESEQGHRPPITIHGKQPLKAINYTMPIASAQVKSALMLAGLYADGLTTVHNTKDSRDHTERMLEVFAGDVHVGEDSVSLGARPLKAHPIFVPGDISSAAFFMVAATLIPGSHLVLKNVGLNPTRQGVIHILKMMGADIKVITRDGFEPMGDIEVRYAQLSGIDIPAKWVVSAIDEFPILFIAACFADGKTTLRGAKELRVKEVDRIAVMAENLQACGVAVQTFDDGLTLIGGQFVGGQVDSMGDHRVAMAFAIAGFLAKTAVTIKNYACISTSFPSFTTLARRCGLDLREE